MKGKVKQSCQGTLGKELELATGKCIYWQHKPTLGILVASKFFHKCVWFSGVRIVVRRYTTNAIAYKDTVLKRYVKTPKHPYRIK